MRILHTEASLGWGGQEIRILRESLGMIRRGHEVFIAADPASTLIDRARNAGIATIPVVFQRRRFFAVVSFLKRLIEERGIDVVNTHSSKDSWLGLPAARLSSCRPLAIRTRHLSTPIGATLLNRLLYDALPHWIMTTGEAIRAQMIEGNGYRASKIVSVPTGVDMEEFRSDSAYCDLREELGLPRSAMLVGTISVIRSWKGIDYLVKALPGLAGSFPDIQCVIAGDGPHRGTLEGTVAEAGVGDRVHFLGHREDVRDVLRSLDVLVHPSYGHEGVPQTILQAMALGTPVISSDLAPLKEIVRDGETGAVVAKQDSDAIAAAVTRLLRNPRLASEMAARAQQLVRSSYSLDHMLDRIENIYSGKPIS